MKSSFDIRKDFIDFFKQKNHCYMRGTPLFLPDDPTLLFTNAGMNQFKSIFLGNQDPQCPRAVNSQRCMRVSGKHNDLEEVGFSPHHHTLFEMLGNWSFGDYYKREAIEWAWELLTEVWKLPKDKLWVSVFRDEHGEIPEDSEAAELWANNTDIDNSRIRYFGRKDNFWEMGETGPCGPCTEIHMDRGIEFCDKQGVPGHICEVNGDCRRVVELWNLVFIQYNRTGPHELKPLPSCHVDTGMGLERVTSVLQNAASNYDTDLFMPIINAVKELSGQNSADVQSNIHAYRVIADHVRAASFLLTDGVLPSNEWRGYVLRRIIRRAVRFGTKIGFEKPFLFKAANAFIQEMSPVYPELKEAASHITSILRSEEIRFFKTLQQGLPMVNELVKSTQKTGSNQLPGDAVFKLYDTYGFPVDITREIASEANLSVDENGFAAAMEQQKERARSAWKSPEDTETDSIWYDIARKIKPVEFTGYSELKVTATILSLVHQDKSVSSITDGHELFEAVISPSPFYAEAGGQTGDTGVLITPSSRIQVLNVSKQAGKLPVLSCKLVEGTLETGQEVTAEVAEEKRKATARNHTATHLLHKALRTVLGDHVKQSGSLVDPTRLRFDFTHYAALSQDDIQIIEQDINQMILADIELTTEILPLETALNQGVTALFGEKYDDEVRVVSVPGVSSELCGGTHVTSTGQIGLMKIISESSISAGVRRIEAVTGMNAYEKITHWETLLSTLSDSLKSSPDDIPVRVTKLLSQVKTCLREIDSLQSALAKHEIQSKLDQPMEIAGIKLVAHSIPGINASQLRDIADQVKQKINSGVAVLASTNGEKVLLLTAVTKDLTDRLHAGKIVGQIARVVGGGGGGRPDMAQAGGTKPEKVTEALDLVPEIIRQSLGVSGE